ncbi:hypothetical protein [Clostridium kluyveri]|uniref:Serine-tRNA synthetase type1 N-terminal domain-containing protein n=2 Tax=Clostridium kluyveri TaxID=1534 RepID=A5MYZ4_CLOK5|nr:hypothetical protein [Clostridium kluyveri]EDK34090.1 Hypothetical protein CKL_2078 [Clostridium kluyveri DSM 555]BAH06873.1 hypothetical protein CKR_1822 [Clostridium kluyveri NBRC 12016]
MKKAIEKLDIMYPYREEREIYENDLKRLRIQKSEIKAAETKGREEGETEKTIKIAEKMLKRGDGIADIVDITELPEEKVIQLKKEISKLNKEVTRLLWIVVK